MTYCGCINGIKDHKISDKDLPTHFADDSPKLGIHPREYKPERPFSFSWTAKNYLP